MRSSLVRGVLGAVAALAAAASVFVGGCAASGERGGDGEAGGERVLLVLTNHARLADTGEPTGFYLPEAAHPWAVFTAAGMDVTLASPRGGAAPIDPRSMEDVDAESLEFLDAFAGALELGDRPSLLGTAALASLDVADFDAVFFAGGHGTMWDFERDPSVARTAERVHEGGGVVAAVCHGPAALVNARDGEGWLLEGRQATGFTNSEERAVDLVEAMPFLLETRMIERGAVFVASDDFARNVVIDGRVVTGQNPASARGAAEAVVRLLRRR